MKLDIYLNYRGNCEQAFRFYEEHLGGTITGMARHAEQPNPNVPADWGDKVLHARIEIGSTVLMGADIPGSEPMRSAYLALSVDTEAEAERVYALLAHGGDIFMKMEQTPFANRFAMLRDRFGTSWMLLHQPQSTHAHHAIDYIEFTVRDLAAAKRFYAAAFGWTFTDYGPDYAGIRGVQGEVGGLHQAEEIRTRGPLVILYSDDLAKSAEAVRAGGGMILKEPYAFPGGRRFHFADPSGNELAVWSRA